MHHKSIDKGKPGESRGRKVTGPVQVSRTTERGITMVISKIVGAVVVAGVVAAGASAFTATGLADNAPEAQFIGGTVSQTVTGASLETVDYRFADAASTRIDQITLTLAGADGKDVTVTPAGGSWAGGGTATQFLCTTVTDGESVCSPDGTGSNYYTSLSGIDVHVEGDQG